MRPGSPGPRPGPPITRRSRSPRRLFGDRGQLEHVELGRALRPWDHKPPAERPDPLEHAGHVALGIVAISDRYVALTKCKASKEHQAIGIVVLPQAASGALAAGLLDDGQQFLLDLYVAEERLETFVRLAPGGRLAELDQPAIIAAGRRIGPGQARSRHQQSAFAADV